jgi:NAD(P)-binding Rossmann-like domain
MGSYSKLLFTILLAAFLRVAIALPRPDGDFDPNDVLTCDVCVIGGGSAGTYAAIRLHDMGKNVVVVEKKDHLGGHVNTYIDNTTGEVINVGVQVFHNTSIVSNYFQRLGVALKAFTSTPFPSTYLDFDSGKSVPGFTPASTAAVGQAFQTYGAILAANYSYLEAGYFLPDPVPEELLIPFEDFATKYGLGAIVPILSDYNQNNGELWKQPTLYVIKAFGLALLQAFEQGFVTTHDVSDLYKSAAGVLGGNVLYSSTVIAMDRNCSTGYVNIVVETPNGKKLVRAKKLLMTGPPMLDNLEGWDLSDAEEDVFGKFCALGYFAGVILNNGIPETSDVSNIGAHNPFNLNSLPGCYVLIHTNLPGQHLAYYGTNAPASSGDARDGIVDQINRLAANGNFPAAETDFLYWADHTPYRLYTSVDEIRNGFYKKLYALQGTKNTFWSGAAWITHDSSLIWAFTEGLLAEIAA